MSKPLRVLMVEDSENDALLIAEKLRKADFELALLRVETAAAMADALEKQELDIRHIGLPHAAFQRPPMPWRC